MTTIIRASPARDACCLALTRNDLQYPLSSVLSKAVREDEQVQEKEKEQQQEKDVDIDSDSPDVVVDELPFVEEEEDLPPLDDMLESILEERKEEEINKRVEALMDENALDLIDKIVNIRSSDGPGHA